MKYFFLGLISLFFLSGCQTKLATTRKDVKTQVAPQQGSLESTGAAPDDIGADSETGEDVEIKTPLKPKTLGVILGPGGMKTFSYSPFLQELAKQKITVTAISGIEFGALVAALYAQKGQGFDVEWQLSKLRESDFSNKGLISSSSKNPGDLKNYFKEVFVQRKVETAKIDFSCPAFQMESKRVLLLSRGPFESVVPFCMGLPPVMDTFQKTTAAPFSVKLISDSMRAKGVDYIVFVNVLSSSNSGVDSKNSLLWQFMTSEYLNIRSPQLSGVDLVIQFPISDVGVLDFDKGKAAHQKGQSLAPDAVKKIAEKLGL